MAKEEPIQFDGTVTTALPANNFRVTVRDASRSARYDAPPIRNRVLRQARWLSGADLVHADGLQLR